MIRYILNIFLFIPILAVGQDVKPHKKASKVVVVTDMALIEVAKQFAIQDIDIQKADTLVGQVIGSYSGSSLANNKVYIKAQKIDSIIVLSGKIDFEKGGFMMSGSDIPDMEVIYGSRGTVMREAFDKMVKIAESLHPSSITFDKIAK